LHITNFKGLKLSHFGKLFVRFKGLKLSQFGKLFVRFKGLKLSHFGKLFVRFKGLKVPHLGILFVRFKGLKSSPFFELMFEEMTIFRLAFKGFWPNLVQCWIKLRIKGHIFVSVENTLNRNI